MPQELINKEKWSEFCEALRRNNKAMAFSVLDSAEEAITTRINNERDNTKKKHLEDARRVLSGLKTHVSNESPLVRSLVDQLDNFGPLLSNLSRNELDDYGRVIEGHNRTTVEQFFLYKIHKEKNDRDRQAHTSLFQVVQGLYDQHVDFLEIAFFVRKLDSLTQIVEVLKWQPSKS
jgi:hypothetical protein